MSLLTAKNYLDSYKKDTTIQYINVCTFLELLVDFEQTNLEEILIYLSIKSFPSTTTLYRKNRDYINPKGDNEDNCKSTCDFFNNIEKTASFSVIMGFPYEIRERYADLYFSLLELFQSDTLKQISFIKKYAAHEAMARGFGYLSKGSIGSLFSSNELVTGLPQKRIDELIAIDQIVKVEIDSKTDLSEATDIQKIVIAKIHEYMDAQMDSYNTSPTHRDEITNFLNSQSNNNRIPAPTITRTDLKSDKERIAELENQLAQVKAELVDEQANDDKELNTKSQNYVAKIILALTQIADLNIDKPHASKEPNTTNSIIFDQIKSNQMKVSNQVIGNWLKLASEQPKDD
ncbi:hypothetical protein [uncultured Psychrobacter sp.]|uniref:hypothetical protein n=1 Tax=uncultured Psychrobacter sp. TaxID=259303 RepID=UPI00345A42D6